MSNNRQETIAQAEARWATNRLVKRPQYTPTVAFVSDSKSVPHHEAAPATSIKVLRNLVTTARANGVQFIGVNDIEAACDNYEAVRRETS